MSQDLRNELLDRGLSDMLQLSEMASVARRHLGGSPSETEVVQATTGVVGELMGAGHAIVGDVVKDEGLLCVRSWGLSVADTIKRIEDEWRALGRAPNLGEVCWLELTETGRAHALATYRPRYRIQRGTFYVWFGGQRSAEQTDFDCLLDVTEAGGFVGIEIPDCRRQLEGVTFPSAHASDMAQWSYDAGRDTFHLLLARPDGLVHKRSSGKARVDDRRSIVDLQVMLGDEVASDDRDLTYLGDRLS
jgi:hypothetical protein